MSLFHVKHNPEKKNVHKEGWHHFIAFFGLFITELCTKTECLQSRTVTTFDGRGRLRQKISCRADSAGNYCSSDSSSNSILSRVTDTIYMLIKSFMLASLSKSTFIYAKYSSSNIFTTSRLPPPFFVLPLIWFTLITKLIKEHRIRRC